MASFALNRWTRFRRLRGRSPREITVRSIGPHFGGTLQVGGALIRNIPGSVHVKRVLSPGRSFEVVNRYSADPAGGGSYFALHHNCDRLRTKTTFAGNFRNFRRIKRKFVSSAAHQRPPLWFWKLTTVAIKGFIEREAVKRSSLPNYIETMLTPPSKAFETNGCRSIEVNGSLRSPKR